MAAQVAQHAWFTCRDHLRVFTLLPLFPVLDSRAGHLHQASRLLDALENSNGIWRFGVFEVDAANAELCRNGVKVKIREQSFRVLIYLLQHAGELVSREALRQVLWPADTFADFDHSLNTAMMKLRDALGDVSDAPVYIETIPKRGYRFIAPVTKSPEPVIQASQPPPAVSSLPVEAAAPTTVHPNACEFPI